VLNIAVIDDDILALRLFRDQLDHMGYSCKIFNNQESALNEMEKFNVVLLDYHLGRTNGKDLLKKIRAQYPDIVAIMISGYMIQNVVNRELKDMLYAFYTKPVDFTKLKLDLDAISASFKDSAKEITAEAAAAPEPESAPVEEPVKRKRGRPRKNHL
jgi:DNA-binding NtrC family response regulator